MASIVGGVGTSHVPPIGKAIDDGLTQDAYWVPLFDGYAKARSWIADVAPDTLIVVYNDHFNGLPIDVVPTFAIGVAPVFPPADEGFGCRPIPHVQGHPELAWHAAENLILDGFDMTVLSRLNVDHGLTVPLSIMFDQPKAWPCRVIPLLVNVIQFPPPTARRCFELGRAIRRAVGAFEGSERVVVVGTGGMSHQLQGERAGLINPEFDAEFLDAIGRDPAKVADLPHDVYVRLAGSEGLEMIMWLVMRGALGDHVEEIHRHYHVAASNTAAGLLVLEPAQYAAT